MPNDITRRLTLTPLSAPEIDTYIKHRLGIAGGKDAVTFLPDAVSLIAEVSFGLPRRINVLCDRALEEGRVAGVTAIDATMVKRAVRSVSGVSNPALAPTIEEPVLAAEPEAAPDEAAASLAVEQPAEAPRTSRAVWIVGAVMLLLAVALLAAGWVWSTGLREPDMPNLPQGPRLKVGAPPPVVRMPSDEEVRAGLALAREAVIRAFAGLKISPAYISTSSQVMARSSTDTPPRFGPRLTDSAGSCLVRSSTRCVRAIQRSKPLAHRVNDGTCRAAVESGRYGASTGGAFRSWSGITSVGRDASQSSVRPVGLRDATNATRRVSSSPRRRSAN